MGTSMNISLTLYYIKHNTFEPTVVQESYGSSRAEDEGFNIESIQIHTCAKKVRKFLASLGYERQNQNSCQKKQISYNCGDENIPWG